MEQILVFLFFLFFLKKKEKRKRPRCFYKSRYDLDLKKEKKKGGAFGVLVEDLTNKIIYCFNHSPNLNLQQFLFYSSDSPIIYRLQHKVS